MARAPSTLPFSLEPEPSPQQKIYQLQNTLNSQIQQRYVSNICRTGPYPLTRHIVTDPFCITVYLLLFIGTIVLFLINYFTSELPTTIVFNNLDFFQKIAYSLNQTLPQILLSSACIIGVGVILIFLVVVLPVVAGFAILGMTLGFLVFLIYSLIGLQAGKVQYKINANQSISTHIFTISLIIITILSLFFTLYLIFKRIKKLKHLPSLMNVVKIVLVQNLPYLPLIFLFLLPALSIGIWSAFTKLSYNTMLLQLSQTDKKIPMFFINILVPVLWLWTHGLLLAIGDYICQSWVLHWYFNSRSQQQGGVQLGLKQNWRLGVFKKMVRYHLGTCVYGTIVSAYLPQNLIKTVQKYTNKRKSPVQIVNKFTTLSRFCYIQTIMQCFDFCEANRQSYFLRQRIKLKIPQIYMLGHFLQETLKILLITSSLYLWFIFTYSMGNFLDSKSTSSLNIFLFIFFCLVVSWGIFLQISSNVSHLLGMVSDVAVMGYCIDMEVERVHYQQNSAHSVPSKLKAALMKLEVQLHLYNPNTNINNMDSNNVNVNMNNVNNVNENAQVAYPSLTGDQYTTDHGHGYLPVNQS